MDARTDIKDRLPSRRVTAGPSRAQHRRRRIAAGGIFKETADVADLKISGRYVAKDVVEIGGISLLMNTLLDNGQLHGDCITFPGRTNAEDLKSAKWNPHLDVVRTAGKPITVMDGVGGPTGNLAPEGAVVKVAGMSKRKFTGPGRCFVGEDAFLLQDSDIVEIDADVGALDVKLTGIEPPGRQTKWRARETNPTSGALWKFAQQVGPAVDGAVTHSGGAHEKQCYADS